MRSYVILLCYFAASEGYTRNDRYSDSVTNTYPRYDRYRPPVTNAYPKYEDTSVINTLKEPIYVFSRKMLDRVSVSINGNFVYSPISTWLQLRNIAEGARGNTLKELRKVTGQRDTPRTATSVRMILNRVEKQGDASFRTQSLVMVDKCMKVKRSFKKKLELSDNVKVLSLNFNEDEESARIANDVIEKATDGKIVDAVDPCDFNLTALVMSDAVSFSRPWARPFNPAYTTKEHFFYRNLPIGHVNMMSQTGTFNYTRLDRIDADVLELPCSGDKYSMLVFLPLHGNIKDIFLYMKKIRIATLFNIFRKHGERLVNVKLPRFKIDTEINNLPELVHDLGVNDIFEPKRAKLKGISSYGISVSAMSQRAVIEVTEEGVSAMSESIVDSDNNNVYTFAVNRPFGFMLVDRATQIILFAGIYDAPSLY